jgi:hypothetical protein
MHGICLVPNAVYSEQNSEWDPKKNMDDKVPTDEDGVSAEEG